MVMNHGSDGVSVNRRSFLRVVGAGTVVGLAGCGGDDDGHATLPGNDYPTVDDWLTESEVAPAADNYDGELHDLREQDTATIEVGVTGNGGSFGFGPPGAVVSTGTEVEWDWTGDGNPHNVVAAPGDQLGDSDYTFTSGDAVGGSGVQYTHTFEDAGVALYHCSPHLSLGMKGGIAVE